MKKDDRDLLALTILRDLPSLPFTDKASPDQQTGAKEMINNEITNAMNQSAGDQDLGIWITTGASKEIPFVRKAIEELGGRWKGDAYLGTNLSGYRCEIPSKDPGKLFRFALIAASHDGKQAQSNLVHRIRNGADPKAIILVGMMGGIPGRVDLLDVVIPTVVYDGTNVGTEDNKPKWARTSRPVHEKFASVSATFTAEIAEEFNFAYKNTKRVVTTGATIEDTNQELFEEIVGHDAGEIVGMEMEGYAVVDASTDQQGDNKNVVFGFVKAVADYGKQDLPARQIEILQEAIPELKDVTEIKPRSNPEQKKLIQGHATKIAFKCAIRLAEYIA
ncbi:hypothetical protein [Neorhizobium sp. DAR64872/K0K18]|uniref:phosphorylase family protein n=1 Tax=Neorhizobium sp. DAR64872/K0K18 TaxID=3421958 RepID=UPI003D2B1F77